MNKWKITGIAIFVLVLSFVVPKLAIIHFSTDTNPDRSDQTNAAWKKYTDAQNGFLFQYPPELAPVTDAPDTFWYIESIDRDNRIYFNFPISDTNASTTGVSSAVSFSAMPSSSTCPDLNGKGFFNAGLKKVVPAKAKVGTANINGLVFKSSEIDECWPADCYSYYQYSIVKNNMCLRTVLAIDDGQPLDTTIPPNVAYGEANKTEAAPRFAPDQISVMVKIIFVE